MYRSLKIFLVLSFLVQTLFAQEKTIAYKVTDAVTGEPVPFATVYVDGGESTIANADGFFCLDAPHDVSVRVTSVGYRSYVGKLSSLHGGIRLTPADVMLREVEVVPLSQRIEDILKCALKSVSRHKRETANYLYRQTTEVNGETTSMVEAFFEARSAFSLRRMRLLAGRYSVRDKDSMGNYTHISNLYPLSQVEVVNGAEKILVADMTPPLTTRYAALFDTDYSVVNDGTRRLYAIRFTPKQWLTRKIFSGTLYVDASTLLPVKMEGKVINGYVITNYRSGGGKLRSVDESVSVVYDISKGYSEVSSVYVSAGYRNGADTIRFSSLMYGIGNRDIGDKKRVRPSVDIRRQIDRLGYDASFWSDKEIVKRTEAEAEMARLFDGGDGRRSVPLVRKNSAALDSLRRFVGNIESFNRLFPQEKAYLHFDNTGYFRGETMWFSAYVVRTDRSALTDMSSVLYVELLDPTGEVVDTRKVRLENGRGSGSFKLDNLLTSGFYEVRAYTRYMLNWDAAWAFSRVLPVFNAPKVAGDYSRAEIAEPVWRKRLPSSREADTLNTEAMNVAFYPEGGRLVQGLASQVAFAVTDRDGRPLDCSGQLRLVNGTDVDVRTLRESRGVFGYTPSSTSATLTLTDSRGRKRTFTLPAADASGCVMTVDAVSDGYVNVEVRRTPGFREPLALVLVNGGNVDATDIIGSEEQTAHRRFSMADMAGGVSQLSLIGTDGRTVAERMVFVYPRNDMDTIAITATGSLAPCGKVSLEARTRPGTTFSLSVRDASSDVDGTSGNAATWLLLSSDLRGYVHNPDYYFEADDAVHRRAADLLMMVQGWRRYDIGQMDGTESFARRHPIEDGLYLYGQLHPVRKRQTVGGVGLRATLYNRGGDSMGGNALTDSLGCYAFRLPDCEGEWTLLLNTSKDGEAAKYRVGIDRNFSPASRPLSPLETERNDNDAPILPLAAIADFDTLEAKLPMDERVHVLKEVKVKGKRLFENARAAWETEQRGAFRSYVRYDCDKAADEIYDRGEEMPGIFEWLAEKNNFFSGEGIDRNEASNIITEMSLNDGNDDVNNSYGIVRGTLSSYGMSYKNRPIIWILNNTFYMGTSTRSVGFDRDGGVKDKNAIKYVYYESTEDMPLSLDEYKSVYISESDVIWQHYLECPDLLLYSPVTVFLYSHHTFPVKHKGLRRTHFDGYSKVETFQMPDYSLMPPEADHRRTLYWNPSVTVGNDGKASIDIYNNSSCKQLTVSAEGITPDGQAVVYRP